MPEDDDKLDALMLELTETDEFQDWLAFKDAAQDAIEQGKPEVTLPTAFLSRVINGLQPLDFPHLRELYDRLREKHGMPKEGRAGK